MPYKKSFLSGTGFPFLSQADIRNPLHSLSDGLVPTDTSKSHHLMRSPFEVCDLLNSVKIMRSLKQ